jgi:putative ABC transport system permease protein
MKVPGFWIIELGARLVPRKRREAWRREWEAETAYAWTRMGREREPSIFSRLRLRARVLSCWIDALFELKEEMRMTGILNDLRYALRGLMRYPAFTAVAVLTLALGIGANTAVFTLVDGVLIRPLPFPEPDGLVSIQHLGREGQDQLPISDGLYLLYKEQASSLGEIAMWASSAANLVAGDEPERVPIQVVTPGFFGVLGVSPVIGRGFLPEEELPGAEPVAILSDGLWERTFGRDAAVMGQTLDLNGVLRRIVGVMPRDFGYPDRAAQLWIPYEVDPAQAALAGFGAGGIARMAPESTTESVYAELQGLISRLGELFPESGAPAFLAEVGLRARIRPLKEVLVGDVSTTLWILLGTVGFVLLIAVANVANLLLVRAESRQRELALRLAMGAGRRDIIRYFMGESILLALAGGALGVLVSSWALNISIRFIPTDIPRMAEVGLDLRVLAFTGLISLGCAIFFGLFPLVRFGAEDLANQLKDGGARGGTGGKDRHRLRNGLVVLQVAMALVLLVGAGLMFRSFQALRNVDPGFEVEGILTARLSLPRGEAEGWEETAEFYRQLRERMEGQPGVQSVGLTQRTPLAGGLGFVTIDVEDFPRGPEEMPIFSSLIMVGEGYFETMGIRLLEGRTFLPGDGGGGTRAALISENFARHWWPETSPIGRRLGGGGPDGNDWWEVVGVVEDVHYQELQGAPEELVYYPTTVGSTATPRSIRSLDIVIRTAGSPLQLIPILRRELREMNSRIPLSNPRTVEDVFRGATARTSFTMAMLGAASGIALILGLVGIYGVISYVVSQRTREIGVRMALGATAPSVRKMVVVQGLKLALGGVVLGVMVAGALSSLMASLLFGVSALDPLTFGGVAAALVAVALVASWLPARKAAGVDPSRALRED